MAGRWARQSHAAPRRPAFLASCAQAVGAALIALGAMPSRLRAKGYGATIQLTAQMKAKLKLKSERRVGLHAISEVNTKYPLEFDAKSADLGDKAHTLLGEIGQLMHDQPELRLSIEGHSDEVGDPQENAKISVSRAQAASATA